MIHHRGTTYGHEPSERKIELIKWLCFDLIFVHSGGIGLNVAGKKIKLGDGQAILLYPDTPTRGRITVPETKISVHHFTITDKRSLPPTIAPMAGLECGFKKYDPYETAVLEQDIKRLEILTHEYDTDESDIERSLVMALILNQLVLLEKHTKPKRRITPEIQSLIEWMGENLAEEISLDDMARQINFSTSHFRTLFKQQVGTSPGSYLLDLRSKEATRLLRSTLIPIKEIASLTGYKDLTHFYHAFKLLHKTTPKAYRDRHLPLG